MDSSHWKDDKVLHWSRMLLDSYTHWTGKDLIPREGTLEEQCHRLFYAPFVVVSHGNQQDPILNYGNRMALTLWEMGWGELIQTPSRLTAEPMNQDERARMLQQAADKGYISDYRGIRISRSGLRFLVENATVWNIIDQDHIQQGQAAAFSQWIQLSSLSAKRADCIF